MRPKRYPYSGKIKASTNELVKAVNFDYSAFLTKNQDRKEIAEQELDKTIQKLYRN